MCMHVLRSWELTRHTFAKQTQRSPWAGHQSSALRTGCYWHACIPNFATSPAQQDLTLATFTPSASAWFLILPSCGCWHDICHSPCSTVPSTVVASSNHTPCEQLKHTLSIRLMKIMLCKRSQLCTSSRTKHAWCFDLHATAHQGSICRAANITFSKVHWVYDIEA